MIDDDKIKVDNPVTEDIVFSSRNILRTMVIIPWGLGKSFHNHCPGGLFDESGGRESGFGPA